MPTAQPGGPDADASESDDEHTPLVSSSSTALRRDRSSASAQRVEGSTTPSSSFNSYGALPCRPPNHRASSTSSVPSAVYSDAAVVARGGNDSSSTDGDGPAYPAFPSYSTPTSPLLSRRELSQSRSIPRLAAKGLTLGRKAKHYLGRPLSAVGTPAPREYDSGMEGEMGEQNNGVRVWYDSYTTIDWIHDAIKESARKRRLSKVLGLRGVLRRMWDRLQGWVIVTVVGIITALIAGAIVTSEALLFDLKEGYCARDWRLAKRFCCPAPTPQAVLPSGGTFAASPPASIFSVFNIGGVSKAPARLVGWAAPVALSPVWGKVSLGRSHGGMEDYEEVCKDWVTWSERFGMRDGREGVDKWGTDYITFVVIAIAFATVASLMTVHLTASYLFSETKNETPPPSAYFPSTPAPPTLNGLPDLEPLTPNGHLDDDRTPKGARRLDHEFDVAHNVDGAQNEYLGPRGAPPLEGDNATILPAKVLRRELSAQVAERDPPKVLYFAGGSGIPEIKTILSGFVIHGYLGFWTLLTKSAGLTLAVASGLSLGKEGPFVHIASCVGNIVCRGFRKYETNEGKRREILSAACAAGVAVAFGAPVGGVLFSLEEVSYYFPAKVMFRSFFCAMIAAVTLKFLDPFQTGKIVLFQVTYDKDWHFYELGFFIIIGLFGGIYGAYFSKLNIYWAKHVRNKTWLKTHPVSEVVLITGLTVVVSFLNGYTRMGGTELVANLFAECHENEDLDGLCVSRPDQVGPLVAAVAWAGIVKGILTIITFGIKVPAGIFIPTLGVGACFGRIVGLLVQYARWTHPDSSFFSFCPADPSPGSCIIPGVYAMVGAAATLSGVTRTTVSLAVIMFELTGTMTYVVPVMLSVLVAKTVADALERRGIYDLVIEFAGLPYLDNKHEYTWKGAEMQDAVDSSPEVIWPSADNTVGSLRAKLERLKVGGYRDGGFPIIVKEDFIVPAGGIAGGTAPSGGSRQRIATGLKMVGYIAANELEHGLATLADHPSTSPVFFRQLPFLKGSSADGSELRDSSLLAVSDPQDFSRYADKAPITVQSNSSLELVQQLFTKLGVRYVVVTDERGFYKGIIYKKRWLQFLANLDEH